jgi:ribosomal protein L37AE/L43A
MAELMTSTTDPASLSACPSCESDVTNVHGIYTCSACSWVPAEYR